VNTIGDQLPKRVDPAELEKEIEALKLPARFEAPMLVGIYSVGHTPTPSRVKKVAQALNIQARKRGRLSEPWVLRFCEMSIALGVKTATVKHLMQAARIQMPNYAPREEGGIWLNSFDVPLRVACLEAILEDRDVTTEQLMPEQIREKPNAEKKNYYDENDHSRRDFRETVGKILPIYKLRAKAISGKAKPEEIEVVFGQQLNAMETESGHRWFRGNYTFGIWVNIACETIVASKHDFEILFERIAKAAVKIHRGSAPAIWLNLAEALIVVPRYQNLALKLIERASTYVTDNPLPARERWGIHLRCAQIVDPHNVTLGDAYFRQAVEVVSQLDDESTVLLEAHARTAHRIATDLTQEQRRILVERLPKGIVLHEPFVSEASKLPREQTIKAVTRLDPASGFALCSQWEDEDTLNLWQSVPIVAREATGLGFISPFEGLMFLRMCGEQGGIASEGIFYLEQLRCGGAATRNRLKQSSELLSLWIRRDTRPDARRYAAKEILEWAKANNLLDLPGMPELQGLLQFIKSLPSKENHDFFREKDDAVESNKTLRFFAKAKSGDFSVLNDEIRQLLDTYNKTQVSEQLEQFWRNLTIHQRVPFLEAFTQIDIRTSSMYRCTEIVIKTLESCLLTWKNHAAVQAWKTGGIKRFLEKSLFMMMLYEESRAENIAAVSALLHLTIPEPERIGLLLSALLADLERFDPPQIYLIVGEMVTHMSSEEAFSTLEWSLDHFEARSEVILPVNPPQESLPDSSTNTLAAFFWATLGHPDKHQRWLALHTVRGILEVRPDLATELLNRGHSTTAGRFQSQSRVFYWMSARLHLSAFFLKLANEQPDLLRSLAHQMLVFVFDTQFPHVLVREAFKQAIFLVVKAYPNILTETEIDRLRAVNSPTACLVNRDRFHEYDSDEGQGKIWKNDRFSIDSMDTLRYWYPNLGHIFHQSPSQIGQLAENWICDRWGYFKTDWMNDKRRWQLDIGDKDSSNRQGNIPRFEPLNHYLEYHAMFCVAGDLIDQEKPISVPRYEDPFDPWSDWLERHLGAEPQRWVADSRSPTPLNPEFFPPFESFGTWIETQKHEFDSAIGWLEKPDQDWLVVWGDPSVHDSDRYGSTHISSALVSPQTAGALQSAITYAPARQLPHHMPLEDDHDEIHEPGFELQGWVGYPSRERDGLEEFDPLGQKIRWSFPTPGNLFAEFHGFPEFPKRQRFENGHHQLIAWAEIWSDTSKRDYDPTSSGTRLWVRRKELLEFLNHRKQDLLLCVHISRRRSGSRYSSQSQGSINETEKTRVYLFRRDGTVKVMDENNHTRKTNRPAT
jgi:hypothetical protein